MHPRHAPPDSLLIAGGTVWSEKGGGRAEVRVERGRIAAVGALSPRRDEAVLDAAGLHVLPGLLDVHVHAGDRIGGHELADSWESAAAVALANGLTTLAGFVTQQPGETLTAAAERCRLRTAGARCTIRFHLTPTAWPWDWDEVADLVGRGFTTFKLYTTYREAGLFSSYDRLAEIMPRLAGLGARLLVHCEDDGLIAQAAASPADPASAASHCRRRPETAEVEAVRRVIELARTTACPTHIVHVSTATAAELVAAARATVPVTCETAPHYLVLDDSVLAAPAGHRSLCTPPLRPETTRARLEAMAAAGVFDLFATDHCAFHRGDKDAWGGRDGRRVPSGLAGVGALVPLVFELLMRRHGRALSELVRVLAVNPARLLGVYPRKGALRPGSDADLLVLDPDGPPRPVVSTVADAFDPWAGWTTTLAVRQVVVRGLPVLPVPR